METKSNQKFEEQINKISELVVRAFAMLIWLVLAIISFILKPFYLIYKYIRK